MTRRGAIVGLTLTLCVAFASSASATDGLWSTDFWGLRKCSVSGKLTYDNQYYAFGYSWTDSKSAVEFTIADMEGSFTGSKKPQLSIESPSLGKPWIPDEGFAEYHASPEADALRRDIANDAPWKLIAKRRKGAPTVLEAPRSNGRVQMAMFDACVATSAKFPDIDNEPSSPPCHWSVTGEASSCTGYAKYEFASTTLELLFEVRRGEVDLFARILDPAVAGMSTIDLKAIGGPQFVRGGRQTLSVAGAERADLLSRMWSTDTAAVNVIDTAGKSTSIPLVSPQDQVDFAMFRACVLALEPAGP